MIAGHQPTIFPARFRVTLSAVDDGTMKHSLNTDPGEVTRHRRTFLEASGTSFERTNLIRISYDTADFCRYAVAEETETGISMEATHDTLARDALATDVEGRTLFLPIADCTALVLVDMKHDAVMLSHLGRHSVEQDGAARSVAFMASTYGSKPADLLAWLSPAVGSATYPLRAFDGKSLHEVILGQLQEAGVIADHIEVANVDTAQDARYFSHSEFKQGHREVDGRQAVAATLMPR